MPITPSRSSREWSASAVEKDREAEAQAARQQHLAAQLAALQAQYDESMEEEKRVIEEAAIDRQKAKDQEFYEISLSKQEKFRATLADNTFTRVAQKLVNDNHFNHMGAIADNQSGFENSAEFKAMLWEAVAGDDLTFLQQAAEQVARRCKEPITDEDISAIRNSMACLSPDTSSLIQPQATDTGGDSIESNAAEVFEEPTASVLPHPPQTSIREAAPFHQEDCSQVFLSTETSAGDTENNTKNPTPIKPEPNEVSKRNPMDMIEQDATPAVRSSSNAISDINVHLTDPLGNVITGEELQAEGNTDPIQRTSTQGAEPETPASTSRKRFLSEEREEGLPTPSEAAITSTSKKRKTSGQKSSAKTPIAKFQEYIEARFNCGDLSEFELDCSVCDQKPKNPRVAATKCCHVYCNSCLNSHKNGAKGKEAHGIICGRGYCNSALGTMSSVSEGVIKQLKEKLFGKAPAQQDDDATRLEDNQNDEMTDVE